MNLTKRFPAIADAKILALPGRDYGFRIVIPKATWVQVLTGLAEEQTWSNFKDEAAARKADTGSNTLTRFTLFGMKCSSYSPENLKLIAGVDDCERETSRRGPMPIFAPHAITTSSNRFSFKFGHYLGVMSEWPTTRFQRRNLARRGVSRVPVPDGGLSSRLMKDRDFSP
jgi:hypothetical protein